MAEKWTEIPTNIRAVGNPITTSLLRRYYKRDEALREDWCAVPQLNDTSSSSFLITLLDTWLWVPGWAANLHVELATFVDTGDCDVNVDVNGINSPVLNVDWTSTQDDTFITEITDGTRSAWHEALIEIDCNAGATVDVTLKHLWWQQAP